MNPIKVTFQEVKDATIEWVKQDLGDRMLTKWQAQYAISRRLGGDGNYPGDTFMGQAGRALDALAADGVLHKVPRGKPMPSKEFGWSSANDPHYMLPETFGVMSAAADAAERAQDDRDQRCQIAAERAKGFGLDIRYAKGWGDREGALHAPVDVFEILLSAYEKAQRHPTLAAEGDLA